MNPQAFKRATGRLPGPIGRVDVEHQGGPALDAAALYHYWYPGRAGVEPCPPDFAARVASVHPDLAVCRPPGQAPTVSRPWLVWYRKPQVTHWFSPGWLLLFAWQERTADGLCPLPLDNRVFANLYRISVREFGSAIKYFEHVVHELETTKAGQTKADADRRHDLTHEYFDSTKIKNIGRGNKFALHHDGSVVPSRGEQNWLHDQGDRALPGSVARERRERRERQG